jgi:hypothetical protein
LRLRRSLRDRQPRVFKTRAEARSGDFARRDRGGHRCKAVPGRRWSLGRSPLSAKARLSRAPSLIAADGRRTRRGGSQGGSSNRCEPRPGRRFPEEVMGDEQGTQRPPPRQDCEEPSAAAGVSFGGRPPRADEGNAGRAGAARLERHLLRYQNSCYAALAISSPRGPRSGRWRRESPGGVADSRRGH